MNYLALGIALRDNLERYHDGEIKNTKDATVEEAIAAYLAVIASEKSSTMTGDEWRRHAEWLNFAKANTVKFLEQHRDVCSGNLNYDIETLHQYFIYSREYFENTLNDIRKISAEKKESQ